jgi:hypothetical protein
MARILRVLIFFFPFRSVAEAFPFYLFGSLSRVKTSSSARWKYKHHGDALVPRQQRFGRWTSA